LVFQELTSRQTAIGVGPGTQYATVSKALTIAARAATSHVGFELRSAAKGDGTSTRGAINDAKDYREIVERLKAVFGGRRLRQIDELSIERHKRARGAAGAPVAANRELAVLKSLFNRCRDDLKPEALRRPHAADEAAEGIRGSAAIP
jgi:hypothetical protein